MILQCSSIKGREHWASLMNEICSVVYFVLFYSCACNFFLIFFLLTMQDLIFWELKMQLILSLHLVE